MSHREISKWDGADFVRFWTKVKILGPDDCWEWQAYRTPNGYGQFGIGSSVFLSSRIAWAMANGTPEFPLHVLHKCDNPPCVNPNHLFLGTHADNVADMFAKGRACVGEARKLAMHGKVAYGEKHVAAKLTDEKVLLIRAMYASGGESHATLGRRFGVTGTCIQAVLERRNWKHI